MEVWQLDHLQFAVPPTQMKSVLMTGIPADKLDAIRAAVSYFKVPGVKDVLAMTNKVDANGRYLNQYDYDFHPQTQGVGKAETELEQGKTIAQVLKDNTKLKDKYQGYKTR